MNEEEVTDVLFPLTSSHEIAGKVRTASVCITPHGCDVIVCGAMPKATSFGAEQIAGAHRVLLRRIGQKAKQRKLAEQMVVRAREGDQNAMAIIALTRDNAARGNPMAKSALGFVKNFVKRNPVGPSFGADECFQPDTKASVALANGPPLNNARIIRVAHSFGSDHEKRTFVEGVKKWNDTALDSIALQLNKIVKEILKLGRTLGQARAIQIVRQPNTPIAAFDKKAAWELGE